MARPSSFTQETADAICLRLANGESLRKICADEEMPDKSTVSRWLGQKDLQPFRDQYARAREEQADFYAEQVVEIADEDPATALESSRNEDDPEVIRVDGAAVQHQRLRVDARKWYASKLAPKKYGDRVTAEHTGPDGAPLIPAADDAEVARRVAFLLANGVATQQKVPENAGIYDAVQRK